MARIAIDGAAGSGKTTLGKSLGEKLGYIFLDAGTLYRAVTWEMLNIELETYDTMSLGMAVEEMRLNVSYENSQLQLTINGKPIPDDLHNDMINETVSVIAAYPTVRKVVRGVQSEIAQRDKVILAGRDIGTIVMPDADLKLFLQVSLEERANRRYKAMLEQYPMLTKEEVLDNLRRRDEQDITRRESPLRLADDAVAIATDGMDTEQTLNYVMAYIQKHKILEK